MGSTHCGTRMPSASGLPSLAASCGVVAKQFQRSKLMAFYAALPDRLWLVPISGGGQFQNNSLHIKPDLCNAMCLLTALGEIDLTNHHMLRETLDQLDDKLPPLLDLRGVQYLDSSALHVLVRRLGTPLREARTRRHRCESHRSSCLRCCGTRSTHHLFLRHRSGARPFWGWSRKAAPD